MFLKNVCETNQLMLWCVIHKIIISCGLGLNLYFIWLFLIFYMCFVNCCIIIFRLLFINFYYYCNYDYYLVFKINKVCDV